MVVYGTEFINVNESTLFTVLLMWLLQNKAIKCEFFMKTRSTVVVDLLLQVVLREIFFFQFGQLSKYRAMRTFSVEIDMSSRRSLILNDAMSEPKMVN